MMYQSTRDPSNKKYTSAEVIKMGLAPDGGLFLPETIPTLSEADIEALRHESYPVRAARILHMFLTDYTQEELMTDCHAAYREASFPGGAAPLVHVCNNLYALELWHGPTSAFKDMALQMLPQLLSAALRKTGEKRTACILAATSGDTGKAAMAGFADVPQTCIQVYYPKDGVSPVQERQMVTQEGENVDVRAVIGNFDDAQAGVKRIFSDEAVRAELDKRGYFLSSANSINWGRLVPQIVYYISAYCDLLNKGVIRNGEEINVCVPTGNFGNIFAAYLAKRMGLPIRRLVCASNQNNVLTDFLATGTYDRNRPFHLTMSPSMDILISSNLERLLCLMAGEQKTAAYMESLRKTGSYTVDAEVLTDIRACFSGYFAGENLTAATISEFFENESYLADTHTAVGLACAEQYAEEHPGDTTPMVVASTASPFKFAADVYMSLTDGTKLPRDPLSALDQLAELTGADIPYPLCGLRERTVRFRETIPANAMPEAVLDFCGK